MNQFNRSFATCNRYVQKNKLLKVLFNCLMFNVENNIVFPIKYNLIKIRLIYWLTKSSLDLNIHNTRVLIFLDWDH